MSAQRLQFVLVMSLLAASLTAATSCAGDAKPVLFRSAGSGPWSAPGTWEGGKLPSAGSKVQIREGHTVVYDRHSDEAIRSLHIAGMDKESCPAIVCCGGRMDFHGAPMNRTWVQLTGSKKPP